MDQKTLNHISVSIQQMVWQPELKLAKPSATATADPELDPPLISSSFKAFFTTPYGLRVPISPVAFSVAV